MKHRILFSIAIISAVIATWMSLGRPMIGIDDANIFFDYAENIVDGRGFTYSNNGVPVEGCTSFLWLMICAFNFFIGLDECGVFACCVICLVAAQMLWLRVVEELLPNNLRRGALVFMYCGIVMSIPGYFIWMGATLMDISLWGLAISCIANLVVDECSMRRNVRVSAYAAVFAILPLVRPESAYVAMTTLLLIGCRRLTGRKSLRPVVVWGALFALSFLALTIFRLWYFGYPLPNTYYAKVSPSILYNLKCGLEYASYYVNSGVPVALFVAECMLCLYIITAHAFDSRRNRLLSDPCFLFLLWTISIFAIPILTGGDHFPNHRFFQPIYPGMCILLVVGFARSGAYEALIKCCGGAWPVVSVIVVMSFSSGWREEYSWQRTIRGRSLLKMDFDRAADDMELGKLCNELFERLESMPDFGSIAAGGISRTYRGRVVDLMGLNDTRIAHYPGLRKGMKNHAAFEPEIFWNINVDVMRADPIDPCGIYKGLFKQSRFVEGWICGTLSLKSNPSCKLTCMYKKSWLEKAMQTMAYDFCETLRWCGNEYRWR